MSSTEGPLLKAHDGTADLPSMGVEGPKTFIGDLFANTGGAVTCSGFLEVFRPEPLVYEYTCDETKYVVEGDVTLTDMATGQVDTAVQADVRGLRPRDRLLPRPPHLRPLTRGPCHGSHPHQPAAPAEHRAQSRPQRPTCSPPMGRRCAAVCSTRRSRSSRASMVAVQHHPDGHGGSTWMHGLRPGDPVTVSRPRSAYAPVADAHRHLLIAGGIGVAPKLAHARHAVHWNRDVRML